MREVKRVADWILRNCFKNGVRSLEGCATPCLLEWSLILFRWLIALPDRAAEILQTGWTVAAAVAAASPGWRRFQRGSLARTALVRTAIVRKGPPLRRIGWMTYCLGQRWTSAPPGLLPALAAGVPDWNVRRGAYRGVPGFIDNGHFLSCSECLPGDKARALGAWGHLTGFSMPACAADL